MSRPRARDWRAAHWPPACASNMGESREHEEQQKQETPTDMETSLSHAERMDAACEAEVRPRRVVVRLGARIGPNQWTKHGEGRRHEFLDVGHHATPPTLDGIRIFYGSLQDLQGRNRDRQRRRPVNFE